MAEVTEFEKVLNDFKSNLAEEFNLTSTDLEEDSIDGLSPKRIGNVTGSAHKRMMTCKSRKKGLDWSMREKLVDFGDTAINYCLEKAIERITGKVQQTATTWAMKWGTNHEPIAREKLFEKLGVPVPEQDFMFYLKNAGSTPDSFIEELFFKDVKCKNVNVEIKCPPTPDNHHKYITQDMDETHEYFWQIQGEMMSHTVSRKVKCDKTLFVSYNPFFPEDYQLGMRIVEASALHRRALLIRAIISERIILSIMADFWERPQTHLAECIADVPSDPDLLDEWYKREIKSLML